VGKRKTLGKGLNALFPDIDLVMDEGKKEENIFHCDIDAIRPNPYQPRRSFDANKIEELAESIRSTGIIQPLIVRKSSPGYELIAGERRWKAAFKAGLKKVPVIIKDVSDDEVLKLSLIENLQRENLNPIEEADAYLRLIEEFNLSQESLAKIVGKDRSTITNTLRLLKLPEEIKKDVASGKISSGHARAILSLDTNNKRYKLYQEIIKRDLSVRKTEELVKKMRGEKPSPYQQEEDPQINSIKEKLQRILGTQVRIIRKGEKGKIEISFFSSKDFERILEIIQGGKFAL
jgi:ParB family chromosome partitioning protein